MKYTVRTVNLKLDKGTFKVYNLTVTNEQNQDMLVEWATPKPMPALGTVLEGTTTFDGQYNTTKFKEDKKGGWSGGFKKDPETQKAIIRQSSMTNAVNLHIAMGDLVVDNIIATASRFAEWSGGSIFNHVNQSLPMPQQPPIQYSPEPQPQYDQYDQNSY